MRNGYLKWVSAAIIAIAMGAIPASVHAAAAIKEGEAQTSIGARGADKALSEIQLAFDPDVTTTPDTLAGPSDTFATTSFQLTVSYDPCEVTPTLILPDPGYTFTSCPVIDCETGTITICGTSDEPLTSLPLGDVDIFDIQFTLNPCTSDDTPLCFVIGAPCESDYVDGTDPTNGDTADANGPDQVSSASLDLSLNQILAELNSTAVPLPAAAQSGAAGLAAVAVLLCIKRRTRCSVRAA